MGARAAGVPSLVGWRQDFSKQNFGTLTLQGKFFPGNIVCYSLRLGQVSAF